MDERYHVEEGSNYEINKISLYYELEGYYTQNEYQTLLNKLFILNLLIKSILNKYLINQTPFDYFSDFKKEIFSELKKQLSSNAQLSDEENKKILLILKKKINRLGKIIYDSNNTNEIEEAISDLRKAILENKCNRSFFPSISLYQLSERKENKIYTAKSFLKYVSYIRQIINKEKTLLWFRGQTRRKYQLVPSIFRQKDDIVYENNMMKKFMINASGFSNEVPALSDYITWLPFMQHYELPTRLLDWTDSPFCALFFAINDDLLYHSEFENIKKTDEHDSIIYVFKCSEWNKERHNIEKIPCIDIEKNKMVESIGSRAFEDNFKPFELYPIAVTATRKYARMRNQKANFTLHDNAFDMYSLYPEFFYKIEIPHNCKEKILKEMYEFGIDKTTFFPELTALAEVTKKFA